MRRNPLYAFKDTEATGIFEVPMNSTIHILNRGDGSPIFVEIISKAGLSSGSTIGEFLANESLYVDLGNAETSLSELEKIGEAGDTQGWRLLGTDATNYGNIGNKAVDLSTSDVTSDTKGATGNYGFSTGHNTTASGEGSVALGIDTSTSSIGGIAVGRYTKDMGEGDRQGERVLVVGVGEANYDRQNGLIVYADGIVEAPKLSINEMRAGTDRTLVTKEYSDDVDGGNI